MNTVQEALVFTWRMILSIAIGSFLGYRRGLPSWAAPLGLFSLGASTYGIVHTSLRASSTIWIAEDIEFYGWLFGPVYLVLCLAWMVSLKRRLHGVAAIINALLCGALAGQGYTAAAIALFCFSILMGILHRLYQRAPADSQQ